MVLIFSTYIYIYICLWVLFLATGDVRSGMDSLGYFTVLMLALQKLHHSKSFS